MSSNKPRSATTQKILKVLGIFGGVQAVGIVCSILRTKLAALWIGPAGVGLMTIYNSTMDLMARTAQLNIDQSAVRDIAAVRDNNLRAARVVAVVRRMSLALGVVGMVVALLLSPLVSEIAFGDYTHTLAFAVLSVWLLFSIVNNGEFSVFRGLDRLKPMARASIWSAIVSVSIAVPLLYFFRLKAVVPVLIIYYGVQCAFSLIYRVRTEPRVRVGLRQAWRESRGMFRLGFYMTVSNTVTLLASGAFVIFLNRCYGETTVGIYQAGYTLVNTYVGIIFTAIVMEYYPRLSTVVASPRRTEVVVSHEIKVAVWVLIPVAAAFICCSGLVIDLLYSEQFYQALPYVAIGAAGVFFRAVSWCLAYTILARGDGRVYVLTEVTSAVAYLALHIPAYIFFGFKGLGVAYTLWYGIYCAVVYAVWRRRYGLRLRPGVAALTASGFCVALIALAGLYFVGPWITLLIVLPPTAILAYRHLR